MPVFHREKAIELAARLLWLAGTSVSAFSLLLLLYLAERAFLLRHAERFTGSSAEALPDGPMLTDVAALFSGEASPAADGFARGPHGLRLATWLFLFIGTALLKHWDGGFLKIGTEA